MIQANGHHAGRRGSRRHGGHGHGHGHGHRNVSRSDLIGHSHDYYRTIPCADDHDHHDHHLHNNTDSDSDSESDSDTLSMSSSSSRSPRRRRPVSTSSSASDDNVDTPTSVPPAATPPAPLHRPQVTTSTSSPSPTTSLRDLVPVLTENLLVCGAMALRCRTDHNLKPFSAVFSLHATCSPSRLPWWAFAAMAACTAGDLILERRRLRRLALVRPTAAPTHATSSDDHSPPRAAAASARAHLSASVRGQLPLERATRTLSSPGLLYGLCILPALFARSSYASFVSHAMAWSLLGLATTLVAYLTRWLSPRLLSRAFQLALLAHLLTPSNPWTVIALALTTAPTLLHAFPRAFALGEVLAVSTALVLVADSLRARPHAAHVVVAAMQHLALGTATACAVAAPWVKRLMSLSKGKGKPESMARQRRRAVVGLYGVLAAVVAGLITPLMYLRSGYEPWTWVIGYIASSRAHMLMIAYWLSALTFTLLFFPWTRSANTQRKTYHLLAIAILLPGYLWTPVFLSLALTVALSAFVFAELLRLAQAPPLGPLLDMALATFRDHRDESCVLTSHVYLLLGLALPVWVGVIEGTWRAGLAGMAALGVGDAVASMVGRRVGTWRWFPPRGPGPTNYVNTNDKSVQGSLGFVLGTLAFFVAVGEPLTLPLVAAVVATAGVEAVSSQFDNFVVPLVMLLTIM